MNWLLDFIREICLVLWLGGLVTIDFVETPIRFRTPGISKEQATAIGSRLFVRLGWLQTIFGVILLLDNIAILHRMKVVGGADWAAFACMAAMLTAALLQSVWITPRMLARMTFPDGSAHKITDEHTFRPLHRLYVVLDALKLLLGTTVLLALTYARHAPT